jgi:hypothetical protein
MAGSEQASKKNGLMPWDAADLTPNVYKKKKLFFVEQ